MTTKKTLAEVEELLQGKYTKNSKHRKVPSDARSAAPSKRVDQLILPESERARLPLTKDKYVVKDPANVVAWERVVRQFLRKLSPRHSHRVSAVMIYEWATGIIVKELMEQGGSANRDLRIINSLLKFYYGKPYMTYIAGKKVPRAYRVPGGYHIKRHRPKTMTLWVEYSEGTLDP